MTASAAAADGATAAAAGVEAASPRGTASLTLLLVEMEDLLQQFRYTERNVHGFDKAAGAVDLIGRCERLRDLMKGFLSFTSTSSDCSESCRSDDVDKDHDALHVLLHDTSRWLLQLKEAKIAPSHRWKKWWEHGGKYARLLETLSNRLNNFMVDYLHHIWSLPVVADMTTTDAVDAAWPPTMEQLQLTPPRYQVDHEELTGWNTANNNNNNMNNNSSTCKRLSSTSTRSTGTASTVSLDSSMRSHDSISAVEDADPTNTTSSGWKSTIQATPLQWDFSPRPLPSSGWGSNGGAVRRRQDRIDQYRQTHILRELESQDIPVISLKVVLAQLEAGDTSPTIVAGKTAMMTLGYLGALMVSPLALTFGLSAKEAFQETPLEAAAVLCHYLIEFELANGTIGTLENCVQDVYLYGGRSTRKEQHAVCTIPMLPGAVGAPDSLTRPLVLRDLIRYRNQQRQRPYKLFENNCKHFCLHALTSGELFPTPTNYSRKEFLQVFFALCQGCYVAKESFDLFLRPNTAFVTCAAVATPSPAIMAAAATASAQQEVDADEDVVDPMMERSDRYDHLVPTMVKLDLEYYHDDEWQ